MPDHWRYFRAHRAFKPQLFVEITAPRCDASDGEWKPATRAEKAANGGDSILAGESFGFDNDPADAGGGALRRAPRRAQRRSSVRPRRSAARCSVFGADRRLHADHELMPKLAKRFGQRDQFRVVARIENAADLLSTSVT
jgi:hypothetical protein